MTRIDYERFLRDHVAVRNESGARAYETGLRTFDCPLCGDRKGRGWLGVTRYAAGCWNPGCDAEPQLTGGAVEWARRVLKLETRADAWRALVAEYGVEGPAPVEPAALRGDDWCTLPKESRPFVPSGADVNLLLSAQRAIAQRSFALFCERQWGLRFEDLTRWGLRWCVAGRHANRVVIPIKMGGRVVAFQTRTIGSVEPKYLTSEYGLPEDSRAECGRPASAILFNLDAVRSGQDALMVEGAGDVMAWHRARRDVPAFALLGVALTPAKAAMVKAARARRVVVALDADAQQRALQHVEDLRTWGISAERGRWVGGKDAGSGARLELVGERTTGDSMRARPWMRD